MDYKIEFPEKDSAVINFQVEKSAWDQYMSEAKEQTKLENPDQLREYVISTLASEVLANAINKDGLKLASQPAIIADDDDEGNVNVTLTCPLVPEVELGKYIGLDIEVPETKVDDAEVIAEMERRVLSEKLWEDLPAGTKAKDGDRVIIDFVGEKDGVPFEGGSAEYYPLVLGSHTFIPGFEEQLVGTEAGEQKKVEVTFPENYFEPSLAGAPVTFLVTVKEVQEPVNPEMTDEFVTKFKLDGVNSVEDLKNKVKAEMEALKAQEAENQAVMQILNQVADNAKVDIPAAMVENQINSHIQELEGQMKQYGLTLDQYLETTHQSTDDLKKSLYGQAEAEIRHALVLDAIAAKEGISAEQKDIDAEYDLLSSVYNFPAAQLKMMIPEAAVAGQIVQKKTMDYLKDVNIKK